MSIRAGLPLGLTKIKATRDECGYKERGLAGSTERRWFSSMKKQYAALPYRTENEKPEVLSSPRGKAAVVGAERLANERPRASSRQGVRGGWSGRGRCAAQGQPIQTQESERHKGGRVHVDVFRSLCETSLIAGRRNINLNVVGSQEMRLPLARKSAGSTYQKVHAIAL